MAKKKNRQMAPSPVRRAQAQAKAKQEAAARRKRRLIIVVVCAVILAVGLGTAVALMSNNNPPPSQNTDTKPSTNPSTPTVLIPPNGTAQMGWIEAKSPNVKPDAIIVDEHVDYQCPICKMMDTFTGATFRELIDSGDIIMRFHVRSFLNVNLRNDSSTRAASAATCADTVGDFLAYHETIFANQPEVEGTGYTDQQLRVDFPAQAGITGAGLTSFQTCYDTKETMPYVVQMETVNANEYPKVGTPAYYVNGTQVIYTSLLLLNDAQDAWSGPAYPDAASLLEYLKSVAG